MDQTRRSPAITHLSWGRMEIDGYAPFIVVVAITPIIVVFGLIKGLAWVIKGFKGR